METNKTDHQNGTEMMLMVPVWFTETNERQTNMIQVT